MRRFVQAALAVAMLLLAFGGGAFMYAGNATETRFARTWPDIVGKDIPIPFPLSDAEVDVLRQERLAQQVPLDPSAPPGEGEVVDPTLPPVDPLAGVDLAAVARDRAVLRGSRLATVRVGCTECHGDDGAGKLVADAMPVWRFVAPNITSAGRTKDYTGADYDRLLRHGVNRDGTTSAMPCVDTAGLADREVSDLAAWVGSLAPSDKVSEEIEVGPLGRFLFGFNQIPLSAEQIDHAELRPVEAPPEGVTVAFGGHIAQTCVGCHRDGFEGGPIRGGDPAWPPAGNLTPHEQGVKGWTQDDFVKLMREGKRPDGTDVDPVMPWRLMAKFSDTELHAMFLYLQSVPALPTGV